MLVVSVAEHHRSHVTGSQQRAIWYAYLDDVEDHLTEKMNNPTDMYLECLSDLASEDLFADNAPRRFATPNVGA